MTHATQRRQRGLTLIEAASVIGIVAILIGITLPTFKDLMQRRQVEGMAAQLETDLHLARSEAVARNESVRVGFAHGTHGSCYVVHTGPVKGCVCDGSGGLVCSAEAVALRSVHLAAGRPVQLQANSASMLFDAIKGTVTPTGTVRVQADAGKLHLVVNVMGRARACTPDASMAGYKAC
jgi:type IV fimbrial biogenesis protein FimT